MMDSDSDSFMSNKKLKEEFVSNLTGSSMLEIIALSAIMPALILLRQWNGVHLEKGNRELRWQKGNGRTQLKVVQNYIISLIADYVLVVLPMLSVLTVLANWTYEFTVLLVLLVVLMFLYARSYSNSQDSSHMHFSPLLQWKKALTSYRFSVMLVTCLTILAVDFPIFPRRYAKTETYGTGLMDLGVGSFVVANALVSREARNIPSKKHRSILRNISPLLFLGFARLIVTRKVDYQVHVGEYGVHWNFFFTLAAVEILSSIFNVRPQLCGLLGICILAVYQASLIFGLNDFLLSHQRYSNLFSMNKEGIFSLFGYLGLYLISISLGHHFFSLKKPICSRLLTMDVNIQLAIDIWLIDGLLWAFTVLFTLFIEDISRRMCNLAYVSFVLAQNFEVLGILALLDLAPTGKALLIEEAFNQNLLAAFLLANLLTGLVNLSINTLLVCSSAAYGILNLYSVCLVSGVAVPKFFDVRLKFW